MSEFWNISEFRTKRKRKGERIEKNVWLEHFKKLVEEMREDSENRERETREGGG